MSSRQQQGDSFALSTHGRSSRKGREKNPSRNHHGRVPEFIYAAALTFALYNLIKTTILFFPFLERVSFLFITSKITDCRCFPQDNRLICRQICYVIIPEKTQDTNSIKCATAPIEGLQTSRHQRLSQHVDARQHGSRICRRLPASELFVFHTRPICAAVAGSGSTAGLVPPPRVTCCRSDIVQSAVGMNI